MSDSAQHILTLSCPNKPGIVAAVATCLFQHGCNILDAQQFDSIETGQFFARIVFDRVGEPAKYEALREDFAGVAEPFGFKWLMRPRAEKKRVMILVSKSDHCLVDLVYRWRIGELDMEPATPEEARQAHAAPGSLKGYAYVVVLEAFGRSGVRAFCIEVSGIIRISNEGFMPPISDGRCPESLPVAN